MMSDEKSRNVNVAKRSPGWLDQVPDRLTDIASSSSISNPCCAIGAGSHHPLPVWTELGVIDLLGMLPQLHGGWAAGQYATQSQSGDHLLLGFVGIQPQRLGEIGQ